MIKVIKLLLKLMCQCLIRIYQLTFSPFKTYLFGPSGSCRFYPSCSDYSLQCYKRHGLVKATGYTFLRIIKCHPWHPGGVDEVPEK